MSKIARQYENEKVVNAVKTAEINRNAIWKLVQRSRKALGSKSFAIKRPDGVVVHHPDEVLEVWKNRFTKLGNPRESESFDEKHFRDVTRFVKSYNSSDSKDDIFLIAPFQLDEVCVRIKTLNKGKAAGYDEITAEHIVYGGSRVADVLCILFNMSRELEYVPTCFREGVQVPLFKGKDTSNLLTDNYRGITLLSSYNKLFKILL